MLHKGRLTIYLVIGLIALQLISLVLGAFFTLPRVFKADTPDLTTYFVDSGQLMRGQIPYRDFSLEYPPLALVPFALPRLAVFGRALGFNDYVLLFLTENAVLSTLIAFMLAQICMSQHAWRPVAPAL